MGFGGSAQSMITIMKNNRALLRKKGSMFKPEKGHLMSSAASENQDLFVDHQKATPLLLAQIREKLQKERKRRQILSLVIFLVLLVPTIWIVYSIRENGKTQLEYEVDERFFMSKEGLEIDLLLRDGDDWLSQGDFKKALFQYEKSLQRLPDDLSVHYRVCLAYAHLCKYHNEECLEGEDFFKMTLSKFPDNEDIEALHHYFSIKL
jgi:tetratricopeptide (TPR) repeat protein